MYYDHAQHARHASRVTRAQEAVEDARRSGPGGFAIPLVTLVVVFGLMAVNALLPGFLGDFSLW